MDPNQGEKILVSGNGRFVALARGVDAHEEWDSLDTKARIQLEQRFRLLCQSDRMLPKEKMRHLRDGIYEIKIRKPRWRALCFMQGEWKSAGWFVTQIVLDPSRRRLQTVIIRAIKARSRHHELGGSE